MFWEPDDSAPKTAAATMQLSSRYHRLSAAQSELAPMPQLQSGPPMPRMQQSEMRWGKRIRVSMDRATHCSR
jgi:hypothetical protein